MNICWPNTKSLFTPVTSVTLSFHLPHLNSLTDHNRYMGKHYKKIVNTESVLMGSPLHSFHLSLVINLPCYMDISLSFILLFAPSIHPICAFISTSHLSHLITLSFYQPVLHSRHTYVEPPQPTFLCWTSSQLYRNTRSPSYLLIPHSVHYALLHTHSSDTSSSIIFNLLVSATK